MKLPVNISFMRKSKDLHTAGNRSMVAAARLVRVCATGRAIATSLLLLAAIVVAIALASCQKSADAAKNVGTKSAVPAASMKPATAAGSTQKASPGASFANAISIQAAVVHTKDLTVMRNTSGQVVPAMQSQIAAQTSGVVLSLVHKVGDWIAAGEAVVKLDDSQATLAYKNSVAALEIAKINLSVGKDNTTQASPKLQLQVDSAQAAVDSAEKFYNSQKALFDLGGISASQLDTAQSQLSTARANLSGAKSALEQNASSSSQSIEQLRLAATQADNNVQQARLTLQNTSIRAPFAGQISAISVQPGMFVGNNSSVFTLVSKDKQINFAISPSDASAFTANTVMSFTVNGKSYKLKPSRLPSAPVSNLIPMIGILQDTNTFAFGTVGVVNYTIEIGRGIVIPISSLQTLEGVNFVYTVAGGKAEMKNVVITGDAGTELVVSGVQDGDTVIISPPPGLITGTPVTIVTGNSTGPAVGDGMEIHGR